MIAHHQQLRWLCHGETNIQLQEIGSAVPATVLISKGGRGAIVEGVAKSEMSTILSMAAAAAAAAAVVVRDQHLGITAERARHCHLPRRLLRWEQKISSIVQHPAAALFGSLDFQMMKRAVLRSRLKGA